MPSQYLPQIYELPSGIEVADTASKSKPCPSCRQHLLLRKKTLSKLLTLALREIARVNIEDKRPATIRDISSYAKREPLLKGRERTMTNNYTGLKYWGFIETIKIKVAGSKSKEDIGYKVTENGINFLNGHIEVPEDLWVFDDYARSNPNKSYKFIHISEARDSKPTSRKDEAEQSEALNVA